MSISFGSISHPKQIEAGSTLSKPTTSTNFSDILKSSVDKVEGMRQAADQSVASFLTGENEDLHTVAMATQRAELAFDMFLQVRNKVVQAYQEVMRMQV